MTSPSAEALVKARTVCVFKTGEWSSTSPQMTVHAVHQEGCSNCAAIARLIEETWDEAIEGAAASAPHTWLDELLSGNKRLVGSTFGPRDIELLFLAVRDRIRALRRGAR